MTTPNECLLLFQIIGIFEDLFFFFALVGLARTDVSNHKIMVDDGGCTWLKNGWLIWRSTVKQYLIMYLNG